jgi:hypothetical protein
MTNGPRDIAVCIDTDPCARGYVYSHYTLVRYYLGEEIYRESVEVPFTRDAEYEAYLSNYLRNMRPKD